MRPHLALAFCLIFCTIVGVNCFQSFELDLFDLVEEIGQNFYDVFGVDPKADSSEIRKAYRKLSMKWHPDKNSEPNAENMFRNIVAIYEVLKDEEKRAKYDNVLVNGLPDWRSAIYYYRRVRKLSMTEISIALSIIITIGHYFVLWAQHFETRLTLEDRMDEVKKRLEKKQKKKKTSAILDEIDSSLQNYYDNMEKPSLKHTLPYRLGRWLFYLALAMPSILKSAMEKKKPVEVVEEEEDEEEVQQRLVEERRRKQQELQKTLNPTQIKKSDISAVSYTSGATMPNDVKDTESSSTSKSKEWSDKDKADLIKAIVKFPSGTANRWVKIGEMCGRTPNDCIQMEKSIRTNLTSKTNTQMNVNASTVFKNPSNVVIAEEPTKSDKFEEESSTGESNNASVWSQEQQKLLEKALKEVGKDVPNRWDKIAECVPNKTKNECITRYKELCAAVVSKKS